MVPGYYIIKIELIEQLPLVSILASHHPRISRWPGSAGISVRSLSSTASARSGLSLPSSRIG